MKRNRDQTVRLPVHELRPGILIEQISERLSVLSSSLIFQFRNCPLHSLVIHKNAETTIIQMLLLRAVRTEHLKVFDRFSALSAAL